MFQNTASSPTQEQQYERMPTQEQQYECPPTQHAFFVVRRTSNYGTFAIEEVSLVCQKCGKVIRL